MVLHHVLVCVCVFCDVCKHLCGCQGVVCVRVCARMNCVFELICFFCAADNNSSQECAVYSGVFVCACVCVWCREWVPCQSCVCAGELRGWPSGHYVFLCVSGVRALRHPRQVCVFVCAIVVH